MNIINESMRVGIFIGLLVFTRTTMPMSDSMCFVGKVLISTAITGAACLPFFVGTDKQKAVGNLFSNWRKIVGIAALGGLGHSAFCTWFSRNSKFQPPSSINLNFDPAVMGHLQELERRMHEHEEKVQTSLDGLVQKVDLYVDDKIFEGAPELKSEEAKTLHFESKRIMEELGKLGNDFDDHVEKCGSQNLAVFHQEVGQLGVKIEKLTRIESDHFNKCRESFLILADKIGPNQQLTNYFRTMA